MLELPVAVWRAQRQRGYVFISIKEGDDWSDVPVGWNGKRIADKVDLPTNANIYFCPTIFRKPHRQEKYALPTVWLHADLDEVDPESVDPNPTSAWRTSKGRWQCLWRSYKRLPVPLFKKLNQRLTYLTGADKGGWSVTKVLRVPGTLNHKYDPPGKVRLLWHDQQHYEPRTLADYVRDVRVSPGSVEIKNVTLPDLTADAVVRNHRDALPKRALRLITAKRAAVGERSERLWELECLLVEAGLSPEEVLIVVRDTVWNKFSGQRRELPQLWAEIQKAVSHLEVTSNGKPPTERVLALTKYSKFLSTPTPTEMWTVEGIWSKEAHGLIAGEPKTFKSIISTDLAVSVASGTRFLGHFEVPKTGPVIVIQEENTLAMMKDRFEKIASSKALGGRVKANGRTITIESPDDLPIHLMNNVQFDLTEEEDLAFLESAIAEVRPRLVVLDPLYLMTPGVDENSAAGMTPILRELLRLKQQYDTGMLIVHHYNKPRDEDDRRGGNRISGTGVFYRWFESAIYLEKGKEPGQVKMTTEHRGAAPAGAIHLEFDLGEMGELDYHVEVEIRRSETSSVRKDLRNLILGEQGITVAEASKRLEMSTDRVKRLAEHMGVQFRKGKATGQAGRPSQRMFLES